MKRQDVIDGRMDALLEDVLGAMKDTGPIEQIAIGTALILIGLRAAPDGEKSKAWAKLRDFLASTDPITKH